MMTPTLEDGSSPGGALVGVGVGPALVGEALGVVIGVDVGYGEPVLAGLSDCELGEGSDAVD